MTGPLAIELPDSVRSQPCEMWDADVTTELFGELLDMAGIPAGTSDGDPFDGIWQQAADDEALGGAVRRVLDR